MKFTTINIIDLIEIVGEETVKNILSDFLCAKNVEIEEFVQKKDIDFAKKKMSITYLVVDENAELAAIFSVTHVLISSLSHV